MMVGIQTHTKFTNKKREYGAPPQNCITHNSRQPFLCTKFSGAPFPKALQYRADALSGWGKLLLRHPVPKIRLICTPRIGDVSDIKLIRTDFFFLIKFYLHKSHIIYIYITQHT